ncbi:MAG: hypothetical protein KDD59_06105 [Bdellovibrionales bacterium]|nr:hypothetical protein [Bdellovibrionales bacterium]
MWIKNKGLTVLWSVLAIPLQSSNGWQNLTYRKIPANKVVFDSEGLTIDVDKSASPLIYPLEKALAVNAVEVKLKIEGDLKFKQKMRQGQKKADDFRFRLGLVLKGENRLNFFQKAIAADWIKKLYSLAPEGVGIDKIYFLNLVDQTDLIGNTRQHPLSELISENMQWSIEHNESTEPFALKAKLDGPHDVLAIWLSSDGDDTLSKYKVNVKSISLFYDN